MSHNENNSECFVMMPISDPPSYEPGHFREVFDELIARACDDVGFEAVRADDEQQADVIHLAVIRRILEAPMAVCDLSSLNPNVMFELGIRQAAGRPVVLIQEAGTPRVFDISPLRAYDYEPRLRPQRLRIDRAEVSQRIRRTQKASESTNAINSIVGLLPDTAPVFKRAGGPDPFVQLVMEEFQRLRSEIRAERRAGQAPHREEVPDVAYLLILVEQAVGQSKALEAAVRDGDSALIDRLNKELGRIDARLEAADRSAVERLSSRDQRMIISRLDAARQAMDDARMVARRRGS